MTKATATGGTKLNHSNGSADKYSKQQMAVTDATRPSSGDNNINKQLAVMKATGSNQW